MFKLKNRLTSRDSGASSGNDTSASSSPASPVPSTASPTSSAPTSPGLDSPKLSPGGLLGRTSTLMKNKLPSSVTSAMPLGIPGKVLGKSKPTEDLNGFRMPGLRRYKRVKGRVAEHTGDVARQAAERRDQMAKFVLVAAKSLLVPDIVYKLAGQGNVFVLKPDRRSTIPLQYAHRGLGTITDDIAVIPCVELKTEGMLQKLNSILGTDYTLLDRKGLEEVLQYCINQNWDFGYAYGMLRPVWKNHFTELISRWKSLEKKDNELRANALVGDTVKSPRIPPRRVWDLYSNRVLPFWAIDNPGSGGLDAEEDDADEDDTEEETAAGAEEQVVAEAEENTAVREGKVVEAADVPSNIPDKLWVVSHAWMDPSDSQKIQTAINHYQWDVPIPKDTTLTHVRIELLNLGAKYIWLDVLCLRQASSDPEKEIVREKEWKLDVPTIGHIYQHNRYQTVITYFNGLGRPFFISPATIRGNRHWINRVWTLQETTPAFLPAGMTLALFDNTEHGDQVRPGLLEQVQRLCGVVTLNPPDIFSVINAIQERAYSNPVDRVGSVGYLLRLDTLPVYKEKEEVEDMWKRLVTHLTKKHRTDLLVLYPLRGDSRWCRWAPSWYQLMQLTPPHAPRIPYEDHEYLQTTTAEDGTVTYWHYGYVLKDVRLHLTEKSEGMLSITKHGITHRIKMTTDHGQPIGAGNYILVGVASMKHWVIGNRYPPKDKTEDKKEGNTEGKAEDETEFKVEKMSVIRVHNPDRTKLLGLDLGITAKVFYV